MSQITRKITTFDSVLSLALLLFSMAIALFYQADDLIGAVGLRSFYHILGVILSILFTMATLGLLIRSESLPVPIGIGLLCFLPFCMIGLNGILGFILAPLGLIPPVIVIFGFCAAIAAWIRANFSTSPPNVREMRQIAVGLLMFMAIYVLGVGSLRAEFASHGSVSFNNRHYFLQLYGGWLDDPGILILYECNQFGLFCSEVYSTSEYYADEQIELVPEKGENALVIRVHERPLYVYRPSPQ